MARTQSNDYAAKRARIQSIATDLFARQGFHACSIIDIANACKTSKSRLYHYFESKEHVLYVILRAHAGRLNDILLPILGDGTLKPRARLLQFTQALLTQNVKYRAEHKLILNELDSLSAAHREEISTLLRAPIDALFGTLLQINSEIGTNQPLQFPAAMMFIGMINWTHTWFSESGETSIDDFAGLICNTFIDGFSAADLS